MGPGVLSRDLEACRMSNEAPKALVNGDFQPEHVNGFPMRPELGRPLLATSSQSTSMASP